MGRISIQKSTKKIKAFVTGGFLLAAILVPVIKLDAQVPQTINYQSRLRTITQQPITASTTIQFSLYSHPSNGNSADVASQGGPLLWKETYSQNSGACMKVQPDSQGYFYVQLGSCTAFPNYINFNKPLYLGVKIESDAEATPRVLLASHPYALNSQRVNSLEATTTATGGQLLALENDLDFNIATGTFYGGGLAINGTSTLQNLTFTVATGTWLNLTDYLAIGAIRLDSTGTSNITSGAYLVGVFDEFDNSNATTVQAVLSDLDTAITAVSSTMFAMDLQQVTDNGATTTNWIQFAGATSAGDILPETNNSFTLGDSTNRWSDIWTANVHIGTSTWDLAQAVAGELTITRSGGSEALRIETNGNMGIGAAANDFKLQIAGHTGPSVHNTYDLGSATTSWRNIYASGTIYGDIQGNINTDLAPGSVVFASTSGTLVGDNDNLYWDDTNKKLGVGTSTIRATARMQVDGNLTLSGNSQPALMLNQDGDGYNGYQIRQTDDWLVFDHCADPWCITINSLASFNYQDKVFNSGLPFEINYSHYYVGLKPLMRMEHAASSTADFLQIATDGATDGDVLTIDRSGRLGLGTSTPEYAVDIIGDTRLDGQFMLGQFANLPASGFQDGSLVYNTPSSTIHYWDGTQWRTVATAEDVRSSLWDTDHDTGVQVEESSDEDVIRFDTAGIERMYIANDGKIGVGTTDPLSALFTVGPGAHEASVFSVYGDPSYFNIANFRDEDGESIFRANGSVAGNDLLITFGDKEQAGVGTYLGVDYAKNAINLSNSELRFQDKNRNYYVALIAPTTLATNTTYILPYEDGSSNQILATDGSGNLSWATSSDLTVANIYTTDGSLSEDRTVDLNGNYLYFQNSNLLLEIGEDEWIQQMNQGDYYTDFNQDGGTIVYNVGNSSSSALGNFNIRTDYVELLSRSDGSNTSGLRLDSDDILLTGTLATFEGATYAADYSANYIDRSLVDKEYVDSAITSSSVVAGNALTLNSGVMNLGGTLSQTTYIDHMGYDLVIREFPGEPETLFAGDNFKIQDGDYEVRFGIGGPSYVGLSLTHPSSTFDLFTYDNYVGVISDRVDFQGLVYDKDYSSYFQNHSLVDKAYVDSNLANATGTFNLQQVTDIGATTTNRIQFAGATSVGDILVQDADLQIIKDGEDPQISFRGLDMGRNWILGQDEGDVIGSTGFYIAEGTGVDAEDALLYLTPNGRLSLGTAYADTQLHIVSESADSLQANATVSRYSNSNEGAYWSLMKARGTLLSPVALSSGDLTGKVQFGGQYDIAMNEYDFGAYVSAYTTEAWSDTNRGMELRFAVNENATTTPTTRFVIEQDGTLTVGDTTNYETLVIDGNDIPNKAYVDSLVTGTASGLTFQDVTDNTIASDGYVYYETGAAATEDDGGAFKIEAQAGGFEVEMAEAGGTKLNFKSAQGLNPAKVVFQDNRSAGDRHGIEYSADYSADFTVRSLVDKEYVDTMIASSSGNIYTMDGTLSEDRTVDLNGNYLNFMNSNLLVEIGEDEWIQQMNQGDYYTSINQDGGTIVYNASNSSSSALGSLNIRTDYVELSSRSDGSNTSGLRLDSDDILLTGTLPSFEGATYAADYSANYIDRSLVDKEYVDNAIVSATTTLDAAYNGGGSALGRQIFTTGTSTPVEIINPGNDQWETSLALTNGANDGGLAMQTMESWGDYGSRIFFTDDTSDPVNGTGAYMYNDNMMQAFEFGYQTAGIRNSSFYIDYGRMALNIPGSVNSGAFSVNATNYNVPVMELSVPGSVFDSEILMNVGTSTPESKVTAKSGSLFFRTDGTGSGQQLYVKTTDSGDTGWAALSGAVTSVTTLWDADHDTGIQVEESADEDIIRFDTAGTEYFTIQGPRLSVLNSGSSVFLGQNAGRVDDLSNRRNVYIGNSAGYNSVTGRYNAIIGYEAVYNHSSPNNTTALGYHAGRNYAGAFGGTMLGYRAGYNSTGNNNVMVGYESGMENSGSDNFFMGRGTGWYNDGNSNIMMGYYTGYDNRGSSNIFFGKSSGYENSGNRGVFLGESAGRVNIGDDNIFLGYESGRYNATGTRNLFLGRQAGYSNILGDGNIFLGYQAGYSETNGDRLYIENSSSANPLIYGEFDNDVLRVNGVLQINNPAGTGYAFPSADGAIDGLVLATDANGALYWASSTISGVTSTHWQKNTGVLSPDDSVVYQVNVNNNSAGTLTGFKAVNTNDVSNYAGAILELKGSGADYTNNVYFGKYGSSFYVPSWAGNGVLATDKNLVIGAVSSSSLIRFQIGGGYTAPNSVATIDSDSLDLLAGIDLNVGGNTVLGDASSDTVTFNARVNSDILPSSNLAYDFGSSTARWNNAWVANMHIGTSTWELAQSADQAFTITYPGKQEFARIDKTGRLGVGTQQPEELISTTGDVLLGQFDGGILPISGYDRQLIIRATDGQMAGTQGTAYTSYQRNGINYARVGLDTVNNINFGHYDGSWSDQVVISTSGNMGIGTSTPAYRLDVLGDARVSAQMMLGQYTLNPARGSQAGSMIYNTASSTPFFWNGSSWKAIASQDLVTLDRAYDGGGVGLGRQINTDSGAVYLTGAGNGTALQIDYSGTGQGVAMNHSGSGTGFTVGNTSNGTAFYTRNQSTGRGFWVDNNAGGQGLYIDNGYGGTGQHIVNDGTGVGLSMLQASSDTGVYIRQNSGVGFELDNNTANEGISINNNSSGDGLAILNDGNNGDGIRVDNDTSAAGLLIEDTAGKAAINISKPEGTGDLIYMNNQGSGDGIDMYHASSGKAISIANTGTGDSFYITDEGSDSTPFVLNASGNLGLDQANPITKLDIGYTSAGSSADYGYMRLLGSGDVEHLMYLPTGSNLMVWDFNNTGNGGAIEFRNHGSRIGMFTNTGLVINDGGLSGVGLRVEGNTNENLIYTHAGNDYVGIGTDQPEVLLHARQASSTVAAFDRQADDGVIISLAQDGSEEGTISVSGNTVSYNAFTGSHYAWTNEEIAKGMLVSLTGENRYLHDDMESEILYGMKVATEANDPQIMGSYLALQESSKAHDEHNPHLVMAVGNGEVWIADNGKNINVGDYLISSDIAGHAQKDTGEYAVSHIIARAAESVDWTHVSESIDGVKHKKISVFFEAFDKNNMHSSVAGTSLQGGDSNLEVVDLAVGSAVFGGTITVMGHAAYAEDTVGQAMIMTGDKRVSVEFAEEYGTLPIVTITPAGKVTNSYWVENASLQGFDIVLDEVQYEDILFNWHAFGNVKSKVYVSNGTTMEIEVNDMGSSELETEINSTAAQEQKTSTSTDAFADDSETGNATSTETGVADSDSDNVDVNIDMDAGQTATTSSAEVQTQAILESEEPEDDYPVTGEEIKVKMEGSEDGLQNDTSTTTQQ